MVEIVKVGFPLEGQLVKESKTFKGKRGLRSIERSWKPSLTQDLHRFWQGNVFTAAIVNIDILGTSKTENSEDFGTVFRTWALPARMPELNTQS